ncbi:MAG TPA: Uma2 family endonuclease [Kofleriaceae bacterium]|nr:Uma2 family endonuclease [Kofleriaceae bacterium]
MVATPSSPSNELVESIDHRIVLHGVPWSHYEIMLAIRGDAPVPRMAYLKGELELMSPSRDHEMIKSRIRQLVEAYATAMDIELWPVGSWTIKSAPRERGVEPDECYTVGDPRDKDRPDLAIEVIWTSGGIGKLEIYRGLGVPEVWQWHDRHMRVFLLEDAGYREAEHSLLLPQLDIPLVARLATASPREALEALRLSLSAAE